MVAYLPAKDQLCSEVIFPGEYLIDKGRVDEQSLQIGLDHGMDQRIRISLSQCLQQRQGKHQIPDLVEMDNAYLLYLHGIPLQEKVVVLNHLELVDTGI